MTEERGPPPHVEGPPYSVVVPPPHDIGLEKAVLGACMTYDVVADVAEVITGRDLYCEAHVPLFAAILELYEDGDTIDITTVKERLQANGDFERVGGILYLTDCANEVATGVQASRHAKILKDHSTKRQAILLGHKLTKGGYDPQQDTSDLLQETDEELLKLAMGQGTEGGFRIIYDIHSDLMVSIDEAKARGAKLAGLDTGFPSINEATGGWENGDLIIFAARPSEGKTALLLEEARYLSHINKVPGAFFSLEMNEKQLAGRQVAEYCNIDSLRVKTGSMDEFEFLRMTQGMAHLSSLQLYVCDKPGISIMEMRARCRRLQKQHGLGFVMADYIQLITAPDCQSREQEVAKVSRGLKGLAKELNVPVIAAAQLSRATEHRADRRPVLADLRESGALEQDADIVAFIYHPARSGKKGDDGEDLSGSVELIFAKQRNGPTDSIWLEWHAKTTSFRDPKWAKREVVGGTLGRFYYGEG